LKLGERRWKNEEHNFGTLPVQSSNLNVKQQNPECSQRRQGGYHHHLLLTSSGHIPSLEEKGSLDLFLGPPRGKAD
jgi:hypothetical protein